MVQYQVSRASMGTITANKVLSDNGTLLFFVTLYFAISQALAPPISKMSDNIIFIASLTLTLTVRVQLRLEVRRWPSPTGGLESHDLHFQTNQTIRAPQFCKRTF